MCIYIDRLHANIKHVWVCVCVRARVYVCALVYYYIFTLDRESCIPYMDL